MTSFSKENIHPHLAFMQPHGINWWPTPPESPDIHPIENLWLELKHNCEDAKTKDELEQIIHAFWPTFTPEKCQNYGYLSLCCPACPGRLGNPFLFTCPAVPNLPSLPSLPNSGARAPRLPRSRDQENGHILIICLLTTNSYLSLADSHI